MLTLINRSELPSKVQKLIHDYAGFYDPIYQANVGYYVDVQLGWPYCIGEVIGDNGIAVYYNSNAGLDDKCVGFVGVGRAHADSSVPPYYRAICTCTKRGLRIKLQNYFQIDNCDLELVAWQMYSTAASIQGKENDWDMDLQILEYLRQNSMYPFAHTFTLSDQQKKVVKRNNGVIWLN